MIRTTVTALSTDKANAIYLLKAYNALLRQYPRDYALIALGIGTQIAFYILYPLLIQFIFDLSIPQRDLSQLLRLVIEIFLLLLLGGLGALVQIRFMAKVGGRVLSAMRAAMAHKLNTLGLDFYTHADPVDLASRFSSDMERIETSLTRAMPALIESTLITLGCFLTMLAVDWRMGLTALALLPVGFAANALFRAKEDALNSHTRQLKNRMLVSVEDFSRSWHLIHAYHDRHKVRSRFDRFNVDYTRSATRYAYYTGLAPVFSDYGINMSVAVIVLVGALLVMHGSLTLGAFVGCFALLRKVAEGSGKSAKTFSTFVQAIRPFKRVQALLNEPVAITDSAQAIEIPALQREIRFEHVDFGYVPGKPVLRDLTFSIRAGSSVAIVGASGSGKSSILKLVARLVDPWHGSICFDGVDIRQATLASLRRNTGHVLQEHHILRGTIAENLRFARHDASDQELVEAARKAEIHDFIVGLPQGYETPLDERGSQLSGGQRQRIAIARALTLDPAVLYLDEPTSMLDPLTESRVNDTLRRLCPGRTVLLATHRLRAAQHMDLILVLQDGAIVESGTHQELLARQGLYRSMWDKQHGFSFDTEGFARVTPERLRAIALFATLDLPVLAELAENFATENFEPGVPVVREGEPGHKFYLTVRGSLQVLKKDAAGVEQELRVLQDGDHFGEIALLKSVPRTATVRTLSNTQCLSLSRERFTRLVESHPALRQALIAAMDARG